MKKFLVALVAMFAVTAASAQVANVGARFGASGYSGFELTAQYDLSKTNYIEGRIGFGGYGTELTGIYNYELRAFNWTPDLGQWFFDAGYGARVGLGGAMEVGVVGTAKLGLNLKSVPVGIAFDFTPSINFCPQAAPGYKINTWYGSGFSVVYRF